MLSISTLDSQVIWKNREVWRVCGAYWPISKGADTKYVKFSYWNFTPITKGISNARCWLLHSQSNGGCFATSLIKRFCRWMSYIKQITNPKNNWYTNFKSLSFTSSSPRVSAQPLMGHKPIMQHTLVTEHASRMRRVYWRLDYYRLI